MNGFIAGTVFIWPDGENGGIQPPAVRVCALEPRVCASFRWGFAPHTRESLILPLRGANFLPGKGADGCESLRLIPGKALFFRRGAQTFCREKAPASVGVCASHPGKPYSTVEKRKLFAGERRRRLCGFAPCTRESPISPLRGANLLPGRAPGGGGGLRLIPMWVCAPFPGKPYFSIEGRKLIAGKSHRRPRGFAPCTRESLILPLRGANLLPGRATGGGGGLRLTPGKALFHR